MKLKSIFIILSVSLLSCQQTTCPKCDGIGSFTHEYDTTVTTQVPINYYVPIKYTVKESCTSCKGKGSGFCQYQGKVTGAFGFSTTYECVNGILEVASNNNLYGGNHAGKRCPACHGRGVYQCQSCSGYGYKTVTKTKKEKKVRYETKTEIVTKTKVTPDSYCQGKGQLSKFSQWFK